MSNWYVYTKKADFKGIAEKFGIDQVIARIIRNRDVITEEEVKYYLSDDARWHNPHLLKDADKSVDIITDKINSGKKIRIIGDYDIDGICSITILFKALSEAGAKVDYKVPHRITDGYGINEHLIDDAFHAGIDTIITCDNGIAAISQIEYAKSKNMTVIVTDHHDIPFEEIEDPTQSTSAGKVKRFLSSNADTIVNPKQQECQYPFKLLCGAMVVYKLVEILYERLGLNQENLEEYKQLAAVATVGDIVDLTDENRAVVKYGLKTMSDCKNIGLKALISACNLEAEKLKAYHLGFVVGPCLNASGRLDTAEAAIELLLENDKDKARVLAEKLKVLNAQRKMLTEHETEKAIGIVNNTDLKKDNVLVVYLPECHESIAGIIAGRIKEFFYKPTIVITNAENGVKGSGRSVEGYNMFEELTRCKHLLNKFGGHPMAVGLSLEVNKIDDLRKLLNKNQTLTEKELTPVTWIDVPMPPEYVTFNFINQLDVLEPFGKGNEKPVFAAKQLTVRNVNVYGTVNRVLKMVLENESKNLFDAVMFRPDENNIPKRNQVISIVYYPGINDYNGKKTIQYVVTEWK